MQIPEIIEYTKRKIAYLRLLAAFGWVYTGSFLYSHLHRWKPGPPGRKKRIAAVWYCPPELPGSNLRLGGWKTRFEAAGYEFDNYSLSWMSDLEKRDHATWSWRYDSYRRLLVQRFGQFLQLAGYDIVWLERSFVIGPLRVAFMERCLKRMVGRVVLDCTDGSDYISNPEFSVDVLRHVAHVTAGCKSLQDFYAARHPSVSWINWVFPHESYKARTNYSIKDAPVIGWMGSPANSTALKALEGELTKVAAEIPFRLLVICREKPDLNIPGAVVDWRPFGPDYYDLLQSFDIGLSPSLGMDFSSTGKVAMKHQEFMVGATPQVCSPVGICEEIKHEDGALIVRDGASWSENILRLLRDEDLRQKLGRRSREIFFSMYTYESEHPKVVAALLGSETPNLGRDAA